ncbi:nucleoside deaminase [Maritalea mediterranea]|uniref:tRNA-specific adenosine deaminase n=1 Tax=Maritalea mediterranea TaxID=2909667 RepID=A0ABS9E4I1_9HYPH|nr:nucleoside deaminase [Maritalea mediterranea]MCF4097776.1 nucleoside deaminase [Maritalea mediterranea]
MQQALELARQAAVAGEVPVGAVIVKDGEIIATAQNEMKRIGDPTAHAEMQAMRKALAKLGTGRLDGCDLYVTLEPCTMCAGAIAHAKLRRVYYGAEDQKGGAVDNGVRFFTSPTCHHQPEVISGIGEAEAAQLLIQFFAERRA